MRDFLGDCHRIETIASQIYQQLAGDPAYAKEVRSVFHCLCNDERAHAREIDLVLQTPEQELDAVNLVSWERIDAALRLAEAMAARVNSRRLSEEEALRLAVDMEQQFVNVHVNNTLSFNNRRVAALFADLGSGDQTHVDQLRQCLHWWQTVRNPQLQGQ